ncbi:MAG TPA: IS200/IS605 family transposase [Cyclobacteriaceae bacterium]
MPNTYTQLYVQFVFAVQNRFCLISPEWEEELKMYITGIVQNHKHKMIAINGMPDHLHVFVGLHPTQSISDLMQVTKGDSSEWINKNKFVRGRFTWQDSYGAFSYSRSQIDKVYQYIMNQKEHHKKTTFIEEYINLLEEFGVNYDPRYIFHPIL